ncbi:MAG: metallophosphoesterase [Spirochaetae bacterium HGW-Spirochaetae-8]|nr:MAG: metallophosphoesterase [Spirochaetae bacterium HGW-Spirochaetae-8]
MRKLWMLFIISVVLLSVSGCQSVAEVENTPAVAAPLWTAGVDGQNKIVIVSDLHMGIDDRYAENVKNRSVFIEFLQRLGATPDVSELVIAGDFLDDWFLPLTYPPYKDSDAFFRQVIKNNQVVFDMLKNLMEKGIKLTYVPGNHDMLLESNILPEVLPGLVQARDARGLGAHVTGKRNEIVIEHGHRYDVFSAPDSVSNKDITGEVASILPPGYFYARIAASWILQGKPLIKKDYPEIYQAPDPKTNPDQYGAYLYYRIWSGEMNRITPFERFEDKVIDIQLNGYHGKYSISDIYPVQQNDGTICAPTLFKNYQRSWAKIQENNQVGVHTSFAESVAGALDGNYFYKQAKRQYLENPEFAVDVVVFGHTHGPVLEKVPGAEGKYYANSGTWIDSNPQHPAASTFVVITTTDTTDTVELYEYYTDGTVKLLK